MYLSIRRGQAQPGALDEAARRVQDGFVPILTSLPGFKAYYLVNAGNDVAITISIFETKEAAEESNRRIAEWSKDNLASLLQGPVEVIAIGEATVHQSK